MDRLDYAFANVQLYVSERERVKCTVGVKNGVISYIGSWLRCPKASKVVKLKNLLITPPFIEILSPVKKINKEIVELLVKRGILFIPTFKPEDQKHQTPIRTIRFAELEKDTFIVYCNGNKLLLLYINAKTSGEEKRETDINRLEKRLTSIMKAYNIEGSPIIIYPVSTIYGIRNINRLRKIRRNIYTGVYCYNLLFDTEIGKKLKFESNILKPPTHRRLLVKALRGNSIDILSTGGNLDFIKTYGGFLNLLTLSYFNRIGIEDILRCICYTPFKLLNINYRLEAGSEATFLIIRYPSAIGVREEIEALREGVAEVIGVMYKGELIYSNF